MRLAQELAKRSRLEESLATADTLRRDLEARAAAQLAEAAERFAGAQAEHESALARTTKICTALQGRLLELEAALEASEAERAFAARTAATNAEALAHREAELSARLTDVQQKSSALAATLAAAQQAQEQAQQRFASDLRAAAEREADVVDRLNHEASMRATLEREVVESQHKSARTRRRSLHLASALRRRYRDERARLLSDFGAERLQWHAAADEGARTARLEYEALEQQLAATERRLEQVQATLDQERDDAERAREAGDAEIEALSADRDRARDALDAAHANLQQLESAALVQADERARLERLLADRDAELAAQAARHLDAQRASEAAFAQLQDKLRAAAESASREATRLQREIDSLRKELDSARLRTEALKTTADQVPILQRQLDESHKENRRQFERSPYGLFRCTKEGTVVRLNHSVVRLLGYRRGDELRDGDFAAAVFECPGDLRWLMERAMSSGAAESVESTWKTRDGRRLDVRLHALSTTGGFVEVAVEDLSHVRALEERLRLAQRMEAVGRVASEVAVTCDQLLRDVSHGGQQWLAAINGDTALRHRGELLLEDVTRAANYLKQFAVYGTQQINSPQSVSVQHVLRDLEPVLKRVAGDDIELVLPKSGPADEVDVEAERVERILVNVASYARERLPQGGRVKIDLASTIVDQRFVARYPNVRPGAHVLISVTEVPGRVRPGLPPELLGKSGQAAAGPTAEKPGVDLGALLALIGDCGGHLWIEAEPSGNMRLKIHLPKRTTSDAAAQPPAQSARSGGRGRQLAGWFRT
jgi:PAS domain-containing protein